MASCCIHVRAAKLAANIQGGLRGFGGAEARQGVVSITDGCGTIDDPDFGHFQDKPQRFSAEQDESMLKEGYLRLSLAYLAAR